MAEGYVRNEVTGEMEYRTDIVMGTPDVFIGMEPGTPEDRVPIEDMYADQYAFNNKRAYERLTAPPAPEAPAAAPAPAPAVPVDVTPEGLQRSAEAAASMPPSETRQRLAEQVKEPTVRDAINKVLGAITGGAIDLNQID